jgi:SAM-dependent methyltransferase
VGNPTAKGAEESLAEEVAEALEAPPALLPLLPELLADLAELGGDSEEIVGLLRAGGLGEGARVLDLGCGKGAAAVRLARELGARVTGVDGFLPFIEEARRRAAEAGVAGRCDFRHGDLRRAVAEAERDPVDAALLVSVGRGLGGGDLARTIGQLRRAVRPGGLILFDDGYLAPGYFAEDAPERAECAGYDETIAALKAHGDALVGESLEDPAEGREVNRRNNAYIRARAERLCETHPAEAPLIRAFVEDQERLVALDDDGRVLSGTWLLLRAGD